MFCTSILDSRYRKYANVAKRWRLSCKPRMRTADSIPIVSTSVCFLPLKMYTGITKLLEFEYKTDTF